MNELHEQIEALLKNDPNRETVLEQALHVVLANSVPKPARFICSTTKSKLSFSPRKSACHRKCWKL